MALGVALIAHAKETPVVEEVVVTQEVVLTPQEYAQGMMTESEWLYFDKIIRAESNWNPIAQNPNSTAFGIGQFLNSTWQLVGCTKTENPYIQVSCTYRYINQRYGSAEKAWTFWSRNKWY